jgi:small subunit ribosomal protein S6e
MAEFKLVLSDPKTGKSVQREAKDNLARALIGKRIKDTIKGELIDLPGYEFVITGGSDSAGFPMRPDVPGTMRKSITAVSGIGVTNKLRKPNPKKKGWRKMKGMRLKKTVAGDTVHDKTAQVNMKCVKKGRDPIFGEEPAAKEVKAEEKKEAPAEKKALKKEKVEKPAKAEQPKAPPEEKKALKKPAAPKVEKAGPPEKPAVEKEERLIKEAEEIDEKVKKDEEEVAAEDEEIAEAEEELKRVDKALGE